MHQKLGPDPPSGPWPTIEETLLSPFFVRDKKCAVFPAVVFMRFSLWKLYYSIYFASSSTQHRWKQRCLSVVRDNLLFASSTTLACIFFPPATEFCSDAGHQLTVLSTVTWKFSILMSRYAEQGRERKWSPIINAAMVFRSKMWANMYWAPFLEYYRWWICRGDLVQQFPKWHLSPTGAFWRLRGWQQKLRKCSRAVCVCVCFVQSFTLSYTAANIRQ